MNGVLHPNGGPVTAIRKIGIVGAGTMLAVMDASRRDFGDPKYRCAPFLRERVAAGALGRKTGRGFHHYGQRGEP